MIVMWGMAMGLPLLLFGGLAALSPATAERLVARFEASRAAAVVLAAAAWAWTAYECDTIGIDVFDSILKRFPGEVWILAAALSFLTVVWMPKNLPVRALCGILMLVPAELFKATRPLLPESSLAAVHVFVAAAYLGAVVGMYGMFYPWRLEKGMALVMKRPVLFRALGAACAALGAALVAVGATA